MMTVVNLIAVKRMEDQVINGLMPNLDKSINEIKKELC